MKIVISQEKLTEYLLKQRHRNDKSKFLNQLGFYQNNWLLLQEAILEIYYMNDSIYTETSQYGITYKINEILKGLNERQLNITTIWIKNFSSDEIRFVTLFPERIKNEI